MVVNHDPSFSYDGFASYNNAAGNVTNDGINNYTYDVEGRQIIVNGNATTFDAFSRAVQIQNGPSNYTQVVYSPSGHKFAFMNGQTLIKYIDPMVAGMAAVHNGDGTGYFQHADWLGSSRLAVTGGGTVPYDRAYAPFGEPSAETATTNRDFTGQTEDTTPGLYDFLFRQQSQSQGRWLVPDPAGLAAVDLTNPQTWNRYAYVANNPLRYIDNMGLELEETCIGGYSQCEGGGSGSGYGGGYGGGGPGVGGGGAGGGYSMDRCGIDPFCIAGGGVNPFYRHDSIISTGWDPGLGMYRGSIELTFESGRTLSIPNIPDSALSYVSEQLWDLGGMIDQAATMAKDLGSDLAKISLLVQISTGVWGVDISLCAIYRYNRIPQPYPPE